jgi:hypothetical protein
MYIGYMHILFLFLDMIAYPPPLPLFFLPLLIPPFRKHAIPMREKINHITKPIVNKGVCHIVALPFTLKSILRQKKNYGN